MPRENLEMAAMLSEGPATPADAHGHNAAQSFEEPELPEQAAVAKREASKAAGQVKKEPPHPV